MRNPAQTAPAGATSGKTASHMDCYNRVLRDLIVSGRARPSFLVSHELTLEEAPRAYERFDKREDGWTKVVLHPAA